MNDTLDEINMGDVTLGEDEQVMNFLQNAGNQGNLAIGGDLKTPPDPGDKIPPDDPGDRSGTIDDLGKVGDHQSESVSLGPRSTGLSKYELDTILDKSLERIFGTGATLLAEKLEETNAHGTSEVMQDTLNNIPPVNTGTPDRDLLSKKKLRARSIGITGGG